MNNLIKFIVIISLCSIPVGIFIGFIGLIIFLPMTIVAQLIINRIEKRYNEQQKEMSG